MKMNTFAALLAVLVTGTSLTQTSAKPAHSTFNAPTDIAQIKAIEEDLNTQTDMNKIIHYYAQDATVIDVFAPGIYKGRKQIFDGFQPQFANVKSMDHKFVDLSVASDGTFACAAAKISFDTVMKDGSPFKMTLRELDAYKKIDGEWQIIQQHVSLPVDAKTNAAIYNGPLPAFGPVQWDKMVHLGPASSVAQAKKDIRTWMDVGALSPNIDVMMGYYGPTNDILVYDSFFPGEMRGLAEVRKYYTPIMGSFKDIKVKMPEFVVDSDGVFGVQIDTQDMKLTLKDGSTQYISLRQSDCMRRVGKKWYSFYEMMSYPIDTKTNKGISENPAAFAPTK
jgi:ketosteroid isomerase-like protein